MNKSGYTLLGIFAALIVIALGGWYFSQQSSQTQPVEEAVSIDAGIALFNQKNYTEAIEIFENVPPGHPREWYSLYYLGSAYIMLKDFQAAVEHLERAYNLNSTETRIMHALGVAYFKLGNLKLSKAYFALVLEIDPTDDEARGLMDIMASLERIQPGANEEEAPVDNEDSSGGQ